MTESPTSPTAVPKGTGSDPSVVGGGGTFAVAVALWLLTYFGLPVDDATKLIVSGAIAALAPLATALWIRLRAWKPDSVAAMQADLRALINELHASTPSTVTGPAITPAQADQVTPAPGDDEGDFVLGVENGKPGRHNRRKGTTA